VRRIITPIADGGIPINATDLASMQDLAQVPLQEALKGVAASMVLSGCIVSNVNTTAQTCTISAGYVFLNDAVMRFPSYTGTYPFYIVEGTPAIEQREFEDNVAKDAFITRSAKAVASATGGSILFNPQPAATLKSSMLGVVPAQIAALQAQIANLQTALETKASPEPIGTVKMWAGDYSSNFDATGLGIGPGLSGWALMNGQNATLDMRSKFPLGLTPGNGTSPQNETRPGFYNNGLIGNTGGKDTNFLTGSQLPSHTHEFFVRSNGTAEDYSGNRYPSVSQNQSDAAHNNRKSITESTGGGSAVENRPSYLVLGYIQKIA